MPHRISVRIYYEDTDCGGVVYYANYLRYCERARTEFLESGGVPMKQMMDDGFIFVVAEASLRYFAPGRYGDTLDIETAVQKHGPASIVFGHTIRRSETGERLVEATVRLGCVNRELKPVRMPREIQRILQENASAE